MEGVRARIYTEGGWSIEITSVGKPDPATAARVILPLILEMWAKQQKEITTVTHADHE